MANRINAATVEPSSNGQHTPATEPIAPPSATPDKLTAMDHLGKYWTEATVWFGKQKLGVRAAMVGGFVLALYLAYSWLTAPGKLQPTPVTQHLSYAPGSPGAGNMAARRVSTGEIKSVNFVVAGVGRAGTRAFLNSTPDRRDPNCTTVVLEGPAAQVQIEALKGKTLTVKGVVGTFDGKPQIVVNDPTGLQAH